MKSKLIATMVGAALTLAACAELECPPGQERRGSACFPDDGGRPAAAGRDDASAAFSDGGVHQDSAALAMDDAQAACDPNALEVCNQRDDDCDGFIDEDITSYADYDGDGVGGNVTVEGCPRERVVSVTGDCNDGNPQVGPGAEEICDELDNNCDGQVDESLKVIVYRDADGDTYGDSKQPKSVCSGQGAAGYALRSGDCDDACASCSPGNAMESVCDQKDDNCDGRVDENLLRSLILDCDGDFRFSPSAVQKTACPTEPLPSDCSKGRWYLFSAQYARDDCNDHDPAVYGCP